MVLMCVMFCTFKYGVSGQVWYLIVSVPNLCLFLYFYIFTEGAQTSCWGRESKFLHFGSLMAVCVVCFILMVPLLNLQALIIAFFGHSHL